MTTNPSDEHNPDNLTPEPESEGERQSCKEDDGCPIEGAVLKREWRALTAELSLLRKQKEAAEKERDALRIAFGIQPEETIPEQVAQFGSILVDRAGTRRRIAPASENEAEIAQQLVAALADRDRLREETKGALEAVEKIKQAHKDYIFRIRDMLGMKTPGDGFINFLENLKADRDRLIVERDAAREDSERLKQRLARHLPRIGAWENDCTLCGAKTDCGDIQHANDCPFVIANLVSATPSADMSTKQTNSDTPICQRSARKGMDFILEMVVPLAVAESLERAANVLADAINNHALPGMYGELYHEHPDIKALESALAAFTALQGGKG